MGTSRRICLQELSRNAVWVKMEAIASNATTRLEMVDKRMKKMLMVSYLAPPQLNAESILVAKTLKFLSQDYQIDLLTVGEDADFKNDPFLLEEMGDRVRVIRVKNPKPKSRVMRKVYREVVGRLFKIDNPYWLLNMRKTIAQLRGDYDVLYSRSQP